jgi:class 3 adenylate cyclase
MSNDNAIEVIKKQLELVLKFPDQNPNPVLKISAVGDLIYANAPAQAILDQWQRNLGAPVHPDLVAGAVTGHDAAIELSAGKLTFSFFLVPVNSAGFVMVYGTDITAVRALTKFPNQNPNPVLKTNLQGQLMYANQAANSIVKAWGIQTGETIPAELVEHADQPVDQPIELAIGDHTLSFHVVTVPEFDCLNIYGTDITASKDNEVILGKLAKYFSRQVYDSIFSGDLEVKIQTQRKKLTIFFSDIRGFSEITERLEPEVLTELITEYLSEMTDIAVKHGGTVDKYIGDAMMVFFGDPKTRGAKDDALACVRMAMEMKASLRSIRARWRKRGLSEPLDIRIGIHTDTCTVGNFGSRDRLDYTTIGNGVNLASRLESNARSNQILISEETYLLIREAIRCQKLEKIEVKNMKHAVQTYEVDSEITAESVLRTVDTHLDGFSVYIDPEDTQNLTEKREALQHALRLIDRLD